METQNTQRNGEFGVCWVWISIKWKSGGYLGGEYRRCLNCRYALKAFCLKRKSKTQEWKSWPKNIKWGDQCLNWALKDVIYRTAGERAFDRSSRRMALRSWGEIRRICVLKVKKKNSKKEQMLYQVLLWLPQGKRKGWLLNWVILSGAFNKNSFDRSVSESRMEWTY